MSVSNATRKKATRHSATISFIWPLLLLVGIAALVSSVIAGLDFRFYPNYSMLFTDPLLAAEVFWSSLVLCIAFIFIAAVLSVLNDPEDM